MKRHAPFAHVDVAALVETIASGGVEAMLAAHEMKRRVLSPRDTSALERAFERRLGFPYDKLIFWIGPECDRAEPARR